MAALATGAEWVLIPENPPDMDNWEDKMCADLRAGRKAGRRDSIVIIAEGARDRNGNIIGSSYVQKVLEEKLQEEVRVTVLGHVQRGGAPSATSGPSGRGACRRRPGSTGDRCRGASARRAGAA